MKKIVFIFIFAALIFVKFPTPPAKAMTYPAEEVPYPAQGITYEFSGVLINYALSFTVEDQEFDRGWLGEAVGDDGLLTVHYAEIEFTNERDQVVNAESLITLKGADGEYNFLSNSWTIGGGNGYEGNGIRIQFWAFKVLDGANVVKSGNENEKAKAAYLSFENYRNGLPTKLTLSFNEPDLTNIKPTDIYPAKTIDFRGIDSVGRPTSIISPAVIDDEGMPDVEVMVIEEPVIEEPVIEEPVIEEPGIEELVIEEPGIEEPVIKEPDTETDISGDEVKNNDSTGASEVQQTAADTLYQLGLFKGTDVGYELEGRLTRAQAATLIVRLLGKEAEANNTSNPSIFVDVPENHWAKNYIMYCYENRITYGTGENTYSPELLISYEQYSALVLRTLGYSASPENASEVAVDAGMISNNGAKQFSEGAFTRGDTVVLMDKALKTKGNGKKSTLANDLQKQGVIDQTKAVELNVLPDLKGQNSLDVISEFVADKFE